MPSLDDSNPIEVAEGIFWLGFADYEAGFSNNPYLILDQDEAILIDPGPSHPFFRDIILLKIQQIISPEIIKIIIVNHQDPDLCGLIPWIENMLHPDLTIVCHPRTAIFLPYYGIRKKILPVGDGDSLLMRSGRKIFIYYTPHLHFAGSTVCYDEKTRSLFSSDIFGLFDRNWKLYADEETRELAKNFMTDYFPSKECIQLTYHLFKSLAIDRILPQHGSIIKENIAHYIEVLNEIVPEIYLEKSRKMPSPEETETLLEESKKWLSSWLGEEIEAGDMQLLLLFAEKHGPATLSLLYDFVTRKTYAMKMANPYITNRIHDAASLKNAQSSNIIDKIYERLMKNQYSMLQGKDESIDSLIQKRFQSIETELAILFIDIRSFTKWCEGRPADEIIGMLNKELEIIINAVQSNFGRVNKIMGDGVLAYFQPGRIGDSLFACLKIEEAIRANGLLPVGIGCSFGKVILGDIGDEQRIDFSMIGEIVNLASRLCSYAKKNEISVSQEYFKRLPEETKMLIKNKKTMKSYRFKLKPKDPIIKVIKFNVFDENEKKP